MPINSSAKTVHFASTPLQSRLTNITLTVSTKHFKDTILSHPVHVVRLMYLSKLSAFCFGRQSQKAVFQAHTVFFLLEGSTEASCKGCVTKRDFEVVILPFKVRCKCCHNFKILIIIFIFFIDTQKFPHCPKRTMF